ncbi:MAG: hypothetical protein ABJ364_08145 [Lentilitoribacter sp.]
MKSLLVKKASSRSTNMRRASTGEFFDVTADYWEISATGRIQTFNFEWCDNIVSTRFKHALKEAVAALLKNGNAGSVFSMMSSIKKLCLWIETNNASPVHTITRKDVAAYLLTNEGAVDYKMKNLVGIWMDLGLSGISRDALNLIKSLRSNIGSKAHILSLDPTSGPYLDCEIEATDRELHLAYQNGRINDAQYVLVQTFRLYGQRSSMVANLKVRDVRTPKHHQEPASIRFEILKQHGTTPKTYGPKRPAPMLFTHALEAHLDNISVGFSPIDWNENAPLFATDTDAFSSDSRHSNRKKATKSRGQIMEGYEVHMTASLVRTRYQSVLKKLNIISPRTGKPMIFNQLRERHTIGTLMAMRGCTVEEIGAWLHHSKPESCEAYIELASRHHQLMSSLLDGKFNHVAGRFLGEVIEYETDAFPTASLVTAPEVENAPDLGACETGGCSALNSLAAPYACFICQSFRLSVNADLDPLITLLSARKSEARIHGDDQYARDLNRHISAVFAAKEAQLLERTTASQQ